MFEIISEGAVSWSSYTPWLVAFLAIWSMYVGYERFRAHQGSEASIPAASVPASLHPLIDPGLCNGCAACTHACPEGKIISMIGNKAELVDPGSCIGHGACKTACPTGAIELVFGSARRGVDIPHVAPDFQTNVPGLYIAGELGGMGLIANAIEQGVSAINAISEREGARAGGNVLDVVIVGGGPAGFAASLAAKDKRLAFVTLEQDTFGGTVAHYPREKLVMTRSTTLPLYGTFNVREIRKEELLGTWESVVRKTNLRIQFDERVERIVAVPDGFSIETPARTYLSRTVLLATGRRGSPRKLGIPGEDLSKVVYSLGDEGQYRNQDVLVVGGGNSAVEAALALAQVPSARVTMSYRGSAFVRLRSKIAEQLERAEAKGSLTILRDSYRPN